MAETKTLLVVEDQDVTRDLLAGLLRHAGYDVVLARNGAEALTLLSGQRPDLILLDMLMPVLDGWHFLEQIQSKSYPPVPILVLTATVLTRQWTVDHGCAGFLRKPIEESELLEEVRRCLPE